MRKNKLTKRGWWSKLCLRYADGGAASPPIGEQFAGAPADSLPATGVGTPAKVTPAQPLPANSPPSTAFTAADVETAKQEAINDYKRHLEEAKDYDKMTAEEKVSYLEQQRAEDKLAQYSAAKLSALELPPELLPFVRGKDEADTDERVKTFKAAYDKGVQAGVDKRFKTNGYLPRGTAAGTTEKSDQKPRGVSIK